VSLRNRQWTRHVSGEEITAILQETHSAELACRKLVDAALEGGGRDNITVVVCRVGEDGAQ